jgi:hypothetical protein
MSDQKNPEKSISESLSEVLAELTTDQLRFVVARQDYKSDKEAAEAIDLKPDTVYRWPDVVKEAVRLMALDATESSRQIRRRNLLKAMMVKIRGLDSNNEELRQKVATEIIEGELGKPKQQTELTGKDGGPVEMTWKQFVEQAKGKQE